ncbi:hypothetical protein ASD44_10380 [Mesorhizobium sp. Root554]|uniref:hypothetical protein n=1 Tax=unclassified Mesorhizobium TaxID=325217 RepID=UPI0006FAE387|nr:MULTISPECIES: hypothetical protein [unclassified Mesorhizobium]KQZ14432.1 hypothetical protein ASD27_10390 [Mesorhizobium sp. Root1471]KQZ36942.1 hypothetical protein ASD44_10380 [Mesorhizobium sp. Root554]
MDRDSKNAAIAALCIILVFGVGAYFMPTLMLALGKVSTVLAGVVAVAFVLAFFLLFWLRGRSRRGKAD